MLDHHRREYTNGHYVRPGASPVVTAMIEMISKVQCLVDITLERAEPTKIQVGALFVTDHGVSKQGRYDHFSAAAIGPVPAGGEQ